MSPRVVDHKARPDLKNGYSVTLQHTAAELESPNGDLRPGYHVYIHYVREPYTGEKFSGFKVGFKIHSVNSRLRVGRF